MSPASPARRLAVIGLALSCVAGMVAVFLRARFESWGGFHGDAALFMTVARGMLNGITPYSGLFENKTPGVFLLSALSLRLTDGTALLTWLQTLTIALFPVIPAYAAWRWRRDIATTLLLLLFGCVTALYVGEKSGQLLPESFGAFFVAAFLTALVPAVRQGQWTIRRHALLALLLLLATQAKEPFLLSALGGALVLLPSWRAGRPLLLTVVIAGVASLMLTAVSGMIVPYVTVYLKHMTSFHMGNAWGTVGEPLWLRFNDIPRILENLRSFSPAFAVATGLLWVSALLAVFKGPRPWKGALGRFLIGTFLNTAAVGLTGDFYFHHFVFAAPLYVACAFLLTKDWATLPWPKARAAGAAAFALLLTLTVILTRREYAFMQAEWEAWAAPRAAAGVALDAAMERCGYERYLNLIDRPDGVYGFVRHSPYGPIFTQYGRLIGAMPEYLDALFEALQRAPIAIITTEEEMIPMSGDTKAFVRESFTEMPPACAGALEQPFPYRILFRT